MQENKNGFLRPDGKKIIQVLVEPEMHERVKKSKIKIQPLFRQFLHAVLENNEDGLMAGDFVNSYVERHKEELAKEILAKLTNNKTQAFIFDDQARADYPNQHINLLGSQK